MLCLHRKIPQVCEVYIFHLPLPTNTSVSEPDQGFVADPDPELKNPDPDPSIKNLMGSN